MAPSHAAQRELVARISTEQDHVLAAVDGLSADQLRRAVAPSGWAPAALLSHLTFDDEIFWIHAILAGDQEAVEQIRDGWRAVPDDPAYAVTRYRDACRRTREILAEADLDQPPRWWPPEEVFPSPAFGDGWQCAFRLLVETATHAGHLDVCREIVDGHQHLVVP